MVRVTVPVRRNFRADSDASGDRCDNCRFRDGGRCSLLETKVSRSDSCDLHLPRRDSIKRVVRWGGVDIGQTHDPGDLRHGTTMQAGYGHLRKSYGTAPDGKAIDFYLGGNLKSPNLFKVRQLDPDTGEIDEYKYFVGFENAAEVKNAFCHHSGTARFGGIELCDEGELKEYRQDWCGCPTADERLRMGVGEVPDHFQQQLFEIEDDDSLEILADRVVSQAYPDPVHEVLHAFRYAPDSYKGQFVAPLGLFNFNVRRNRVGWKWKSEYHDIDYDILPDESPAVSVEILPEPPAMPLTDIAHSVVAMDSEEVPKPDTRGVGFGGKKKRKEREVEDWISEEMRIKLEEVASEWIKGASAIVRASKSREELLERLEKYPPNENPFAEVIHRYRVYARLAGREEAAKL